MKIKTLHTLFLFTVLWISTAIGYAADKDIGLRVFEENTIKKVAIEGPRVSCNFEGTEAYNDFAATCRNGMITGWCESPPVSRGFHANTYSCEGANRSVMACSFNGTWAYAYAGPGNNFAITCRNGIVTGVCGSTSLTRGLTTGNYSCESPSEGVSCTFNGTWAYKGQGVGHDFAFTCRNNQISGFCGDTPVNHGFHSGIYSCEYPSPLKVHKDTITYAVALVAPTDPSALKTKVQTAQGVKALKVYTEGPVDPCAGISCEAASCSANCSTLDPNNCTLTPATSCINGNCVPTSSPINCPLGCSGGVCCTQTTVATSGSCAGGTACNAQTCGVGYKCQTTSYNETGCTERRECVFDPGCSVANCSITAVKVYTNTISGAGGKHVSTYDDFRGSDGRTVLDGMTALCQAKDSSLIGISDHSRNYACISGQPRTSRHNGNWVSASDGEGWCAGDGQAVEWLYCQRLATGTAIKVFTKDITPSSKNLTAYDDFRSNDGATLLSAINSVCKLKNSALGAYGTTTSDYACKTVEKSLATSRHNGSWTSTAQPGQGWCTGEATNTINSVDWVNCQPTDLCCNYNGICDAATGETTDNCPWDCPAVNACSGTITVENKNGSREGYGGPWYQFAVTKTGASGCTATVFGDDVNLTTTTAQEAITAETGPLGLITESCGAQNISITNITSVANTMRANYTCSNQPLCGNGICNTTETPASCPTDCPAATCDSPKIKPIISNASSYYGNNAGCYEFSQSTRLESFDYIESNGSLANAYVEYGQGHTCRINLPGGHYYFSCAKDDAMAANLCPSMIAALKINLAERNKFIDENSIYCRIPKFFNPPRTSGWFSYHNANNRVTRELYSNYIQTSFATLYYNLSPASCSVKSTRVGTLAPNSTPNCGNLTCPAWTYCVQSLFTGTKCPASTSTCVDAEGSY